MSNFACGTIKFEHPQFKFDMMDKSAIFKGYLKFQTKDEPYETKLSSEQIEKKGKISLVEERKICEEVKRSGYFGLINIEKISNIIQL